jgi:hypothetical protein
VALVLASFIGAAWWLPHVPPIKRGAPFEASASLDALPGRARVLNDYVLGGWLLWTARDTSPAIDGRTEIYTPDYVAQAMGTPRLAPGWRRFIARNDFDAVWLSKDAPLVFALTTLGWTKRYANDYTIILVPPQP